MLTITHSLRATLVTAAAVTLLAACTDDAPVAPVSQSVENAPAARAYRADIKKAVATMRRVTARYHDIQAAIDDGFVLLHPCEVRPGEGPVGIVYVHFDRLLDGVANPASPDALVYEPAQESGREKLVGVEFAIPYAMWTDAEPPSFYGHEFQGEDEFGVYGLHAWVWRENPNGMFEEANPRVSCGVVE